MDEKSFVIRSRAIFDGVADAPFSGHVAVCDGEIVSVGEGDGDAFVTGATRVIDVGDALVTPGLVDAHCFFQGWLLQHYGADLSGCASLAEAAARVAAQEGFALRVGHGLPVALATDDTGLLDEVFADEPCVLVCEGAEAMVMNAAAEARFGFTPRECWSERAHLLLAAVMADHAASVPLYRRYLSMMNGYGVTATKEMGYDDDWFVDEALALESEGELTVRVSLMSQPVGRDADIEYGLGLRHRLAESELVDFSGYNQMTDGSIGEHAGEMKEPYLDFDGRCSMDVDWAHHADEVRRAEEAGFRFSLHTQGDGAVSHALDIYEGCARDDDGRLRLRHAMTDLEAADPADFARMAALGVVAEVYPLIQSIASRAGKAEMIRRTIGEERGTRYWNRRGMLDAGVTVACATDLPMTFDDLGTGIYSACGGYFPEGGSPLFSQNMVSPAELLRAWCAGGAFDLMIEDRVGTLEPGKRADIAVFDRNVLACDPVDARGCACVMTFLDGRVVHDVR
ncbi:amidohydrolase [Olsenella intestinalis]|uniref:amidohydrolase n=1 Tax=Olsenella intestinalis TaxID=2930083 RepID=UPI00200F5355|nr:amidohydrolase family protein [Olsenella intestinalis]